MKARQGTDLSCSSNSPKCSAVLVMLALEVPFVVRCSFAYFIANVSSCRVATNTFVAVLWYELALKYVSSLDVSFTAVYESIDTKLTLDANTDIVC